MIGFALKLEPGFIRQLGAENLRVTHLQRVLCLVHVDRLELAMRMGPVRNSGHCRETTGNARQRVIRGELVIQPRTNIGAGARTGKRFHR